METPCRTCGGAAHPSTGCAYTPTFIVCKRCTLEAWTKTRGLLAHINGKGGRKGFYFYEYAMNNGQCGQVSPFWIALGWVHWAGSSAPERQMNIEYRRCAKLGTSAERDGFTSHLCAEHETRKL